jgi:hypothetical protein
MYRRFAVLSCLAFCGAVAGCSSSPSVAKPASSSTAQNSSSLPTSVPGWLNTGAGCGGTAVGTGRGLPAWADVGGGGIPWAVGRPPEVVGVVFATELVAKGERPDGSANKILWLTRAPISPSQLTLRAQSADAATPVVNLSVPRVAGYQQFPSIVDLPTPGCWQIKVSWGAGPTEDSTFGLTVLPGGSLPPRP